MINTRIIKIVFIFCLILNVIYFCRIYSIEETRVRKAAADHLSTIVYHMDDLVDIPKGVSYSRMNHEQKVAYLLREVEQDKDRFWLAHTDLLQKNLMLKAKDFLAEEDGYWAKSPKLYYDPRFTLSIYLDELRDQLETKNKFNDKSNDKLVTVPFAWSDWVDLTLLNEELLKPTEERLNCEWLQSKINKPTKYPNFCKNLMDITDEELKEIGLPSKEFIPGFVVKGSPMNKAPHKQVMMQGKAHLLLYQENPLSIIFLTKKGTYEAQVSDKKRIVHTDLLQNYLMRNGIKDKSAILELNPTKEFSKLQARVPPRPLNLDDDIYRMNAITRQTDVNASRELYLSTEAFNYKQEQVDAQIKAYEDRFMKLDDLMTNELHYDPKLLAEYAFDRHELNHYNGLKYANLFEATKEPTYYKLATLLKDKENRDSGWHYEWRFFNGALRYIKDDWTMEQLETREQIILDRLLRNWFRFAEEKGIISWIAHGPLLAWYWNGLMFPYDLDIDIQMPSSELNRLSKNYNMTLVIEDLEEGYGKFLIECATFLHHRDMPSKDNHIDARFIDIDTGTYIDITGIGKNNEVPPPEYDSHIRNKNANGGSVELYMDRRKHWLNFESINPLRYSMIGGVPVYVPNDIMSMLNREYSQGTRSYHFGGYYYVPLVRLWVEEKYLLFLFDEKAYKDGDKINKDKLSFLVRQMTPEDKVRLLQSNNDILVEYYLTHKHTALHEIEKKFMLDSSLQHSILDLKHKSDYHQLTSRFKMGKPLRKSLWDYSQIERHLHTHSPDQQANDPIDEQKEVEEHGTDSVKIESQQNGQVESNQIDQDQGENKIANSADNRPQSGTESDLINQNQVQNNPVEAPQEENQQKELKEAEIKSNNQ
ncbi:uncharacterized protein PRCAT00004471001 [Priceomyces carsonii]|uniref:uncharacterized protein n=1 Tax=Priceomyces carsonii TaxID=28549 RepID=UPI002ED8D950|nr:unnamed protein product [Priceomyces carsonii]